MVNAIVGQTNHSGVARHYQAQTRLDPVGTLREIQAVTRLASNPATLWQLLDAIENQRSQSLKGKERDRTDHFRFLRQ